MKQNIFISVFIVLLITVLSSACAPQKKAEVEAPVVKPAVAQPSTVKKPIVKDKAKHDIALPADIKLSEKVSKPESQPVLLLLSSSARQYQQLATELSKRLAGRSMQITLSGQRVQDMAMIRDVMASNTRQIVAIGLSAASYVKNLPDRQVIFTHVVNYHDQQLLSEYMKGVSALPSPERLFKDWKALSPGLSRVAVICGNGLEPYLKRAREAARASGVELVTQTVSSDKGFIYKSKHLKADINGQWILPDNRVLSAKALKEVMAYASRRGRQIVVFTPKLLPFGGLISVEVDPLAIADVVLLRLKHSAGQEKVSGESISAVMDHTMGINGKIAQQLNLNVPATYRKYLNGY